VRLFGEQDISTAASITQRLEGVISRTRAHVSVDLTDVGFMDASTIGVFVVARRAVNGNRSLTLRGPSRAATRLLKFCDLDDLIEPTARTGPSEREPASGDKGRDGAARAGR
jgi:anti-anti-sigma factor